MPEGLGRRRWRWTAWESTTTFAQGFASVSGTAIFVFTNTPAAGIAAAVTTTPHSQNRLPGTNATFNVTAAGTAPLVYQWRKDNAGVSGQTITSITSITFSNLASNGGGSISVVVTNAFGAITSAPVNLLIAATALITNSVVGSNLRFQFNGETGVVYRMELGPTVDFFNPTTVTNVSPTLDGLVTITNTPPREPTLFSGSGCCRLEVCFARGILMAMYAVCHRWSRTMTPLMTRLCALLVAFWLQASPLLRWASTELSSGNLAAIVVRIGGISAALLGGVQAVSGASTSFNGPFTASGQVGGFFNFRLDVVVIGNDDMHSFTAENLPPGIQIVGQGLNTAFLRGTPTQAGNWNTTVTGWENNDATGASASDTVSITISAGTTPPTISIQPASIRRLPDTNAVFTVVASGTSPLSYHWRKGLTPLAALNSPTLTLTNLSTNSAGNYSVIVSNTAGTLLSASAALAIASQPTIASSRVGQSIRLGFTGETGVTYRVETSTVPTNSVWNTLTNLTPVADGPIAITNAPASSNLFYRLRLLGP